jgi:hypothetical protein
MQSYIEACPQNLEYCTRSRRYIPSVAFSIIFSNGTLDEYSHIKFSGLSKIPTYPMQMLQRSPRPEIVRLILEAINERKRLDINYASFTNPLDGDRIISPHSIISDGLRWHVRAWCEKSQGFRDFVLSRIKSIYGVESDATVFAQDDESWNHWLSIKIEPDARLNQAQQDIVALDYGMQKNEADVYQRTYQIRRALLIYTLQNLRLDRTRERGEAQQIMLSPECLRNISQYLP